MIEIFYKYKMNINLQKHLKTLNYISKVKKNKSNFVSMTYRFFGMIRGDLGNVTFEI